MPNPAARSAITPEVTVCAGVERAYWLFSQRKTTGRPQIPAMFIAS